MGIRGSEKHIVGIAQLGGYGAKIGGGPQRVRKGALKRPPSQGIVKPVPRRVVAGGQFSGEEGEKRPQRKKKENGRVNCTKGGKKKSE